MIQFNLLPDVKLAYIRARRAKRLVTVIAIGVVGAAVTVFVLLFLAVNVVQKQHLNNLSRDIDRDSKTLKEKQDLDKVLTIQNQLNKLTELHDGKSITSRLKNYLAQVTPSNVTYAEVEVKVDEGTMRFKGAADSLKTVNQFVDTLKFTTFQITDQPDTNAFNEVVLVDFGRDVKGASFEITLKYKSEIFASNNAVKLVVPNLVTTRSVIEKPNENLFKPLSNPDQKVEQ
jgi:hypothetical protein